MRFVLLNGAVTAPLASQVTGGWLARVAAAATVQLNRDVGRYWGGTAEVRVGASITDVAVDEVPIAIMDRVPDAPAGMVAAHNVTGNAQPYAVLDLSTCNTLDDVSIAITHELPEAFVDPACNDWVDDGQGHEWAKEVCDPVESNFYRIDTVAVSDFVLPHYFEPGGPPPYCYTAAIGAGPDCVAPFVVTRGGYAIQRTAGSGETQVDGEIAPARVARKRAWTSRSYRRGLRI